MNHSWNGDLSFVKIMERMKESYEPCKIAAGIQNNYLWVLCAIGVPGNILTIITALTMQVMSPATFYVALLASFDGMALITKVIFQKLDQHDVSIGNAGCKLQFVAQCFSTIANWMLVLICAERFISVCFPLKTISIVTKRRSYISAAVLSGFFIIFFGFFYFLMRTETLSGYCNTSPEYFNFWIHYWYWITAALYMFLPFLLVFVLTTCIIRSLYISRRDRRNLTQKESAKERDSAAQNKQRMVREKGRVELAITIMMIVAAILFILFTLPTCVFYLITDPYFYKLDCNDSPSTARWHVFNQVQYLLVDSTHALNFFMYFLSVRRFRKQLFKLLLCKARKKKRFQNTIHNTASTQLSTSTRANSTVSALSPFGT